MEFFTADEIPELFNRLGWSQRELAEYVGSTPNTVGNWLKGRNKRSLRKGHRAKFIELRKQLESKP